MISKTGATASADARLQRYRLAERALWEHYGLEPRERFVELASPPVRLRLLEVGSGDPVLLVHGTIGPGAWASLVRELPGFRCLVLDRPGWGLSSALDYAKHEYKAVVPDVLRGALDALGVEQTAVVGGSIGAVWALRLAARHPSRVHRVVLLGAAPLLPESRVPVIVRLFSSPIGALMVRETPARVRLILRQTGHGASLDAGRIPEEFVQWRAALTRDTDSMRHERDMVRAIASWRGYRPGLTFEEVELAEVQQPTLYVFGTADPTGTVDLTKRAVELLPRAELALVDDAGHMLWFDDPSQVGSHVRRFLAG